MGYFRCGGQEMKLAKRKFCVACLSAWEGRLKKRRLAGVKGWKAREAVKKKHVSRTRWACTTCGPLCKKRGKTKARKNHICTCPAHAAPPAQ